ncbi:unnamed protein product [Coregonus sp. 'balchen']|nr:unnamed protein product [Coregonus sp. 'balchen']
MEPEVFILEETVQEEAEEERTVSTACQTDPWVPDCSCAAVEKRSTGTITKELEVQLDYAHDHQYLTESCPYTPQMRVRSVKTGTRCFISSSLKRNGFAITMETECVVGHRRKSESQTRVGKLLAGNMLVPSAVFLTGGSHSTFVETCHLLSLVSMSLRQFANQQRIYIVPEFNYMWTQHTDAILATIGDSPLIVSGDARCDCASFGTYNILDSASHLILAQETVHVTEVKNSYWLETEGLERCLQHIEVLPWVRALTHHLWYCASTAGGSVQVLKEKWITAVHHITNEHQWVTGDTLNCCDHPPTHLKKREHDPG